MEAADQMSVVLMSKRELNRIDNLARLESGRLTPAAAAELLRVSERQVYRLQRRFREDGPTGIADRRRGRPSNNRLPDVLREQAVSLVRQHYADFGPTLAAEKLEERHALRISRETLRTWMIQAGLWLPRAERKRPLPHGLITDLNTPGCQHLLDHTQAKREPEVQPDRMADHFSREAINLTVPSRNRCWRNFVPNSFARLTLCLSQQ